MLWFTLIDPSVFFQWHHPPLYVAVSSQQCLICWCLSCVLYHLFHHFGFGTWTFSDQISMQHHWSIFYMWYLDMILTYMPGQWSDDSLCTLHFSYTCIHIGSAPYLIRVHAFLSLSMVMPASDMSYLSDFYHWYFGRLKSSEVLSSPRKVISMHTIHFGHNVPLLTSYIRGHML